MREDHIQEMVTFERMIQARNVKLDQQRLWGSGSTGAAAAGAAAGAAAAGGGAGMSTVPAHSILMSAAFVNVKVKMTRYMVSYPLPYELVANRNA